MVWPIIAIGSDLRVYNGAGQSIRRGCYAIGVNSVFSVTADLNHDGKPDLAFLNYGYLFKPPTATVLLHH
jgi:hypothetical protein